MPHQPVLAWSPGELLGGRVPRRIGRRFVLLDDTPSTNSEALDRAMDADADGLVVIADHQTAGRGRLGRRWLTPRGAGVLCTCLLVEPNPPAAPDVAGRLTLVAAVAACEAIGSASEVRAAIKWPNDLRVGGRKLGGILLESRQVDAAHRAWAIGIGINCLQQAGHFPAELAANATSLDMLARHPVHRRAVAAALLERLDAWIGEGRWLDGQAVSQAWMSHAEPLGGRVRLMSGPREYQGVMLAIDPQGGLIVQLDEGPREWFNPMTTTLL